jgi:hypothetical protein
MVRTAYTLRIEDDDWGQAGTLVRDVMDEAERERLVDNVVGHLRAGVSEPVLQRVFDYWRNIDPRRSDRKRCQAMSPATARVSLTATAFTTVNPDILGQPVPNSRRHEGGRICVS